MKTKSKVLIGLMALCLAGVGSTALALTIKPAVKDIGANLDKAVYLYWGNGSVTNAEIDDIDELVKNTAQYRFVTVAPRTSTNLTGTVSVTFTISPETTESGNPVLTGLTVKVFEVADSVTDANVHSTVTAEGYETSYKVAQLDSTHLSGTATISVTASYTGSQKYAMQFVHDGSDAGTGNVFGGKMTITQSFAAD